jgi:hypothetical protein
MAARHAENTNEKASHSKFSSQKQSFSVAIVRGLRAQQFDVGHQQQKVSSENLTVDQGSSSSNGGEWTTNVRETEGYVLSTEIFLLKQTAQ